MLRWEYNYPCSSCYTEPDLRFLVAKSKSLSFSRERFVKNSDWMGIGIHPIDQKHANRIESKYSNVEHIDYLGWWGNHGMVGTRKNDWNAEPFFYKEPSKYRKGAEIIVITLRAIFAGRDNNKTCNSLRESCEAKCLVCNTPIVHKYDQFYTDRINGGVILDNRHSWDDNTHRRYEIICHDCYVKWLEKEGYIYKPYWDTSDTPNRSGTLHTKELISFTRFFSKHNIYENA